MKTVRALLISTAIGLTLLVSAISALPVWAEDNGLGGNLESLAIGADSIVIGTVGGKISRWNDGHTRIFSLIDIAVEDTVKGPVAEKTITVIVPGGEVNGITEWVTDTPTFNPNERAVLFLKRQPKSEYEIFGASRGKLNIDQDRVSSLKIPVAQFKQQIDRVLRGETLPQETAVNDIPAIVNQTIAFLTPDTASAGTGSQVTITGSSFGLNQGSVNFFYRTGQPAIKGTVVNWSDTSIKTVVPTDLVNGYPASASSGPLYVQNADGTISNNYPFSVTFAYGGVKWSGTSPIVNYRINANTGDTTDEMTAVRNAATTWSNVPDKSFTFNYAGATAATGYGYNGQNEIMWVDMGASGTLAQTVYWSTGSTLLECDIEFNDDYNWSAAATPSPGYFDIESIALHELGHVLNLRDLYGNLTGYYQDTAKVMYGFGSSGAVKRGLSDSDEAGIRWIYPAGTSSGIFVTLPNGGENWMAGNSQSINWGYSGSPGSYVKIELLKGGLSQTIISASAPVGSGGTGSFSWTVPAAQASGSDYRIRITSTSNTTISDTSDNYFTITGAPAATLTVIAPNGGENWTAGNSQSINWGYSGSPGSYVKIELLKGGLSQTIISASAPVGSGGTGSFSWTVPAAQASGSDYRVRITSTADTTINDTSDNNFTITGAPAATLTVIAPNGGENWTAGNSQSVNWGYSGSPGSYVKIELLKGGLSQTIISASAPVGSGGAGSFTWTMPPAQASGSDYRVRITSTADTTINDTSDNNFTITGAPAATLTVIAPNGGENWTAGNSQSINWGYSGSPGSYVKIELLKGGLSQTIISASAPVGSGGTGSFSWTVPAAQASGSDYRIRITSTSNTTISDTSDNYFTITGAPAATLTVIAPNGGESWPAGTTKAITWTYTGSPGTYLKIELLKGSVTNRVITYYAPIGSGGNGLFNWTLPVTQTTGGDYQIRITSTANTSISDTSDNNFTITGVPAAALTLMAPNGGESWPAGTTKAITWTYTGSPGAYVKIELLKGGIVNTVISAFATVGTGGSGSFNWTVPATQTTGIDYRIRITSTADTTISDTSDNNFTISGVPEAALTVTAPNGGESWPAGTTRSIAWTYTGSPGTYVKIELLKSGFLSSVINTAAPIGSGGNGVFNWMVPVTQTTGVDYRIRITSTANTTISDTSDNNFTITGVPAAALTLTAPNGGESWPAGTTKAITWTYTGSPGAYVKIELLKGGIVNTVISSFATVGTGGSGSFNWTVPATQTTGIDYRIRITSTADTTISDTSDNNFTISGVPAAALTVTAPNGGESWPAGTIKAITWTYTGTPGTYVRIELLKGGVTNSVISFFAPVGSGGTGSFNWTVPAAQTTGSDYRIRITSTSNTTISDTSDNDFTISGVPATALTLTAPNGGESWPAGTPKSIAWTYSGNPGSYVKIELLKGSVTNIFISTSAPVGNGGAGSFNWTVPAAQTTGSDYRIRITSTSNTIISDTSDNYFTITGAPATTIMVTTPSGGEAWSTGTTKSIIWTYTGSPGSYVKIELLKSGILSSVINTAAPIGSGGNGVFNWTVPVTQTTGVDYRIRITSTADTTISDTNDNNFTITGAFTPTLTVTSPNSGESWPVGTSKSISWSYSGSPGTYVKIELLKGGILNRVICTFAPIGSGGNGTFNWTVPATQTTGNDYTIKITSTASATVSDISDGNFTLALP